MPTFEVHDLGDERLLPYRQMRTSNWTNVSGRFIAEGPLLVKRLLASNFDIESLLLSQKVLTQWHDLLPPAVPVLVVPDSTIGAVVGYDFHRGIIGCGRRKPELNLRTAEIEDWSKSETLVGVQGVQDPENLGGILRSCAALGIRHVLIGPRSADPLSRRALRVSMGTVLKLQLFRSPDLISDLAWLREIHAVTSVATTLSASAESLERARRHGRVIVLLGNEAHGLSEELQRAADRRVRIDMQLGTDSLNVSVAAGIILHHFTRSSELSSDGCVDQLT